MTRTFTAVAAGAALLLGTLPAAPAVAANPNDLIVHVYDIGQGSCVLIECPDDLPILIDCGKMKGGGGTIQAAAAGINAVLAGYDEARPLRVILSHGDLDHYSLLGTKDDGRYLIDPEKVRTVYFGGAYADYGTAKAWISAVDSNLTPARPNTATGPCDTPAAVSCLLPNETRWGSVRQIACGKAKIDLVTVNAQAYYTTHRAEFPVTPWKSDGRKNGDSAVVRIRFGATSFVLTGDAQEMTERLAIVNATRAGLPLTGTTFLFGSHHGAKTHGSNGMDWIDGADGVNWIDATSPSVVIFSSNLEGDHGHPTCAVVSRFDSAVYPGGGRMTAISGGLPVRCDKEPAPRTFGHRFLVTEANQNIRVTVTKTSVTVACAVVTAACDGPL